MSFSKVLWMSIGLFLVSCAGTTDNAVRTTKIAGKEKTMQPDAVIAAIKAIDAAKAEKKGGALLAKYKKESEEHPKDRYLKFLYYYSIGDKDESWQRLNGMTYMEPGFPWPYLGRGLIYDSWGSTMDKAEQDYRKFTTMLPGVAFGHQKLGDLLVKSKRFKEAVAEYEKAISVDSKLAEAYYGMALAKWYMNDLDGAQESFAKAIKVRKDYFDAWFQLGMLKQRRKDSKGALEAFLKAASINPDSYEAHKYSADMLLAKGDKQSAISEYEAALKVKPNDIKTDLKLAKLYEEIGNLKGEIRTYERAKKTDPRNAKILVHLGMLYMKNGDKENAEVNFKEGLKLEPKNVDARLYLARIAVSRQDWIPAIDRYLLLLEEDPNNGQGKQEFAKLLEELHVPADGFSCSLRRKTFSACLENVLNRKIRPFLSRRYRELVKKTPELKGGVELEIRIDKAGRVRGVRFVENQLKGQGFDAVIYACFWVAHFPKGPGGKWNYAMEFEP
ncbi:MAG: tetratricopeptide repeat protein [Deltaproteobacteria bacterium]|nr:tetratricopeptide repeat protein [Deltaproteobacteria bacterium]